MITINHFFFLNVTNVWVNSIEWFSGYVSLLWLLLWCPIIVGGSKVNSDCKLVVVGMFDASGECSAGMFGAKLLLLIVILIVCVSLFFIVSPVFLFLILLLLMFSVLLLFCCYFLKTVYITECILFTFKFLIFISKNSWNLKENR